MPVAGATPAEGVEWLEETLGVRQPQKGGAGSGDGQVMHREGYTVGIIGRMKNTYSKSIRNKVYMEIYIYNIYVWMTFDRMGC